VSKIVFDADGQRFFEAGIRNCVLYKKAENKWTNGVAWNGISNITESPDGAEANDIYADDIKYASMRSAETYGGSIEAYMYPPEFEECDGAYTSAKGVYIGQQIRKPFSLCYRTMIGSDELGVNDDEYKLHLVYNATVSPSEKSHDTINDSPDAGTMNWDFDTTPVSCTGHKSTSKITIDTTKLSEKGKTALATLLEKLYGTESTEPELPLPDEIMEMFKEV